MIIYIHGFGSSGQGNKAQLFRDFFQMINVPFIAPSLSYIPELSITTLQELIESYDTNVHLIGSSLGGFYAMHLAQKYGLKAILINPSIYPFHTLKRTLGYTPSYFDNSHFEWQASHLQMLKMYQTEMTQQKNFMLLLQTGDEILDYQEAVAYLPQANTIVEQGGNHSFVEIERYFAKITDFFQLGK